MTDGALSLVTLLQTKKHKNPAETGNYDYFCQVLNTFCVSGKCNNSCASEASLLTVFAAKIRL